MKEELYNKIDKFCNETDWSKYPTYEHALEEFIKGIVAEGTKELKAQIEKMKCCGNCKYSNQESVYSIVCKVGGVDKSDYINIDNNQVCDKWEIKNENN